MEKLLPDFISDAYRKYKYCEMIVFSWIAAISNECGYKAQRTHLPVKATQYRRVRYKGRTKPRNTIDRPATEGTINESARYAMPTSEILERLDLIIDRGTERALNVPPRILDFLERSITHREICSAWYRKNTAGDVLAEESNDGHVHFTGFLKKIRAKLEPFATSEAPSPSKSVKQHSVVIDVRDPIGVPAHGFAVLNVSHLSGDDAESLVSEDVIPQLPQLPDKVQPQPPKQDMYEAESTTTDMVLAMSCLLDKLQEVRQHNMATWTKYKDSQISLIQATVLANTAIELARTLEEKFAADFPDSPVWETLVGTLFPRETTLWEKRMSAFTQGNAEDLDRTFQLPTNMLKVFRDMHNKCGIVGVLRAPVPQINRVYDPRQAETKLDCLERLNRQKILLDSILVELAMQAHWKICPTGGDQATTAFCDLLDSGKVRLWAAFSIQLLSDVNVVLGDTFSRPFKDLRTAAAAHRQSTNTYIKASDNPLLETKMTSGITKREYEEKPTKITSLHVFQDDMIDWRAAHLPKIEGYEYAAKAAKPFSLFNHHPMLAGSLAITSCLWIQHWAADHADDYRYVTAVLHLYNALRQESCVSEARGYFEHMEKVYGPERVFLGQAPVTAQAYEQHYLVILGISIQTFAAKNNRLKKGRRVLNNTTDRPRDLRELSPLSQMLRNHFPWGSRVPELKVTDIRAFLTARQPLDRKQAQPETEMDPIELLTAYGDCLGNEQHRFDFDYYQAWHVCWKLLRRIEAAPLVQSKFRKEHDVTDSNVDRKLYLLPLFIFEQHLTKLEDRIWMKSVGETVDKFFREELPIETLEKEKVLKEIPEDPADIMYAPEWEIDEPWHPTKDGKCHHVGICELQVLHWRQQAALALGEKSAVTAEEERGGGVEIEVKEAKKAKKTRRRYRKRKGRGIIQEHEGGESDGEKDDEHGLVEDENNAGTASPGDYLVGQKFKSPQGTFDVEIPFPSEVKGNIDTPDVEEVVDEKAKDKEAQDVVDDDDDDNEWATSDDDESTGDELFDTAGESSEEEAFEDGGQI
ncbi:MAG: hypothetical protein Q9218_004340 [Villophora microphyllina]